MTKLEMAKRIVKLLNKRKDLPASDHPRVRMFARKSKRVLESMLEDVKKAECAGCDRSDQPLAELSAPGRQAIRICADCLPRTSEELDALRARAEKKLD